MIFKKISLWAAAASISLLAGCNLYNPNGAEESSCPSDNADCYIALGLSLSQKGNFDASIAAYSKAIAIDSTKSDAYWGYATSAKFKYNLTLPELLSDIDSATAKDTVKKNGVVVRDSITGEAQLKTRGITAFLDLTNEQINKRIQLGVRISKVMSLLSERDSLTQWWYYLTDSTKRGIDTRFEARKAFITAYLAAHSADPSRNASKFPLSDGRKKYGDARIQYLPYLLYSASLGSCNLGGAESPFTQSDRSWCETLFHGATSDSGFGGLGDLAERMKDDTVFQQDVNNKILEIQSGTGDLATLLSQLAPGQKVDTSGGAPQQTQGNIDSIIAGLGGTMVFYQFGDKLDNDGDGCVDEEIVDSTDNDLDGFIDEDSRVLAGNGSTTGPADGVDNDHNGLKDLQDAGENRFSATLGQRYLTFVGFGGGQDFIKIKKADNPTPVTDSLMNIRIAIQADSLAAPSRASLPGYAAKLQHAKDAVGGCWRNYNP